MTVFVDTLRPYTKRTSSKRFGNGNWSCHLACDGDLGELHRFAQSIGVKPYRFQNKRIPHYDLTPQERALAVLAGAEQVSSKELVRRWHDQQQDDMS